MNSLFEEITKLFRQNNIENPRLEARIIFGAVLGVDYAQICGKEDVSPNQKKKITDFAEQRIKGKPLDKIIGIKSFYKNDFFVDENVLSPRPETEILVEKAVEIIKKHSFKRILDMGTGSGCILLSILDDCPEVTGIGIDISAKALQTAKKNTEKLGLGSRVELKHKSWSDIDFSDSFSEKFDIIVSNPPYIPIEDEKKLMTEVRYYDPKQALFGGEDGLSEYRKIAKVLPNIIKNGGYFLLEAGINQAGQIKEIFEKEGFLHKENVRDLAGIERCIIFKK